MRSTFVLPLRAFLPLILISCEWVSYSPYATKVPLSHRNSNLKELSRLLEGDTLGKAEFSFALITDIQGAYDHLRDAVGHVEKKSGLEFVIVGGDITNYGVQKEYLWTYGLLNDIKVPFLSVIGNHDALANGPALFENLYGPLNFTFQYRGTRFILFNDNVWGFSAVVPDFEWLTSRLEEIAEEEPVVLISHQGPGSDQWDEALNRRYRELINTHQVTLSLHGHSHRFKVERDGESGPVVLHGDDVADRNFLVITVNPINGGIRWHREFF